MSSQRDIRELGEAREGLVIARSKGIIVIKTKDQSRFWTRKNFGLRLNIGHPVLFREGEGRLGEPEISDIRIDPSRIPRELMSGTIEHVSLEHCCGVIHGDNGMVVGFPFDSIAGPFALKEGEKVSYYLSCRQKGIRSYGITSPEDANFIRCTVFYWGKEYADLTLGQGQGFKTSYKPKGRIRFKRNQPIMVRFKHRVPDPDNIERIIIDEQQIPYNLMKGRVEYYNSARGFGTIFDNSRIELYFHVNEVDPSLNPSTGQYVTYYAHIDKYGLSAIRIREARML
ncbi:MAG: hypothetical protein ABII01_03360 [Candidatus Woesearchaeota archaeon]